MRFGRGNVTVARRGVSDTTEPGWAVDRRRRSVIALLTALACMGLLASCAAPAKPVQPPPTLLGTELDAPVPTSVLELPLTDQHGRAVTLDSYQGKIVVVSDMMTLCQETCAIGTASMLQAARVVDRAGLANKIVFLSITIDPDRDDSRHLVGYERMFGRLPNWELLTGSPAVIRKLWDRLGVWRRTVAVDRPYPRDWLTRAPLTVDIQHSDDLIFIDANQQFRFEIDGPGSVPSVAALPKRVYSFMDRLGHRNVRNPSPGSWSSTQVERVLHWLLDLQEHR
jgi:cytochrome oxidase Cu insertion factor (SCO1/SenC/PrrC family)